MVEGSYGHMVQVLCSGRKSAGWLRVIQCKYCVVVAGVLSG